MSISIDQLKSGTLPVDSNGPKLGENIDGNKLRDFGNGLTEFDPTANGFMPEVKPPSLSDKDKALSKVDEALVKKREEFNTYMDLYEENGGEVSEVELREALGQGFITKGLDDGDGGKFEEKPDTSSKLTADQEAALKRQEELRAKEKSELDELERELEGDIVMENQQATVPAQKPTNQPENVPQEQVKAAETTTQTQTQNNQQMDEQQTAKSRMVSSTINTDKLSRDEDADLAALDSNTEEDPDDTKDFEEKLKAEITKKMRPVSKKYDLSSMTVINSPVTVNNVLGTIIPITKKSFTWALMRSQRPITMTKFSGTELNNLNSMVQNPSQSVEVLKNLYEHIIGAGKGDDFYKWAKCTCFSDINHIWFCAYGACFNDCNYIPYSCAECNEVTIADNIDVQSMAVYSEPKFKDTMQEILKMPADPIMGNVFAEYRIPISDTIVMGFREPSIYDMIVAPRSFDDEFREKYADIIGYIPYIADIYLVCQDDNGNIGLRKVATKEYPNNEAKTLKAKVIQYAKLIRALDSDSFNIINGHIGQITKAEDIYYQMPEITCDHCKSVIEAGRTGAADLLFTRHRLAVLGV